MGIFDRFKQQKPEVIEGYQSFSTPFGKIGRGDLSLPYVNGRYQVAGYVPFVSVSCCCHFVFVNWLYANIDTIHNLPNFLTTFFNIFLDFLI